MAQTANMVHCQLWMGGLEPYMTESFILASFQRMGEKPLNVKVMRNKFSGEPAGYCFVHFENDDEAIDAMHKLNGKVIPNTNPAVRFRLNTASNQGKIVMNDREFSLWVGDLSQEVDDYTLYKCFAAKYQSIKAAKVILDASGYSKGFGFLRFGLEEEQKHCLAHMNGYKGLGSKPLKISNAIPKSQRGPNSNGPPMPQQAGGYQYPPDYSNYYDPNYWQHYGQWGGYGYDPNTGNYQYDPNYAAQYGNQYPGQYNQYPPPSNQYPQQNYPYSHPPYPYYPPQAPAAPTPSAAPQVAPPTPATAPVDDSNEVVEHSPPVDVEKENREYSDAILNFWVDLASHAGLVQEVFEEETDKLNMMEVSLPVVSAKLENKEKAIQAVEAQDSNANIIYQSESGESDGDSGSRDVSADREIKKRKLSVEESKDDLKEEPGEENEDKKDGDLMETDVKAEVEDGVGEDDKKVEDTSDVIVKDENTDPLASVDDVDKEDPENTSEEGQERNEKTSEKWNQVMGFMAEVDVDVMMNETETVSSESSSDVGSESETEKANRKRKVSGNGSDDAEAKRLKSIADLEDMGQMDDDEEEVMNAMEVDKAGSPMGAGDSAKVADSQQEINNEVTNIEDETRRKDTTEVADLEEIVTIEEVIDDSNCEVVNAVPTVEEDSEDDEPLSSRLGVYKEPSKTKDKDADRLAPSPKNGSKSAQVSDDSNSSDACVVNNDNNLSELLNGNEDDPEGDQIDAEGKDQEQSDKESNGSLDESDSS
ncbi:hypothetical protein GE061_009497 [Apolygus lucorum]|uniref:tRNA selenocysteine-associated protein 1 n=1 Tax=Apolygus lucorum TaxID=248454 RepID=A0A8S9Y1N9_APOLU|nr:hypothetical protein GE061_009497 [Apolygus lucorum]